MSARITDLPADLRPGGRFDAWRPARPGYLVCDVDGTLVGPSALPTPAVLAAVQRARAAGLRVGYATGRSRAALLPVHEYLGAPGPHVVHNGAEVLLGQESLAAWYLTPTEVDGLLAIALEHDDAYVEVYLDSGYLVSSRDERASVHWEMLGPPLGVLQSAAQLDGDRVLKATFAAFSHGVVGEIETQIAALGLRAGTASSPLTPELVYINATHRDAGKGPALQRAAASIGVALGEVVTIGDEHNDLSMFELVGTAIAMGQAPEEVRRAAHLVVPDVDADGAAVAIDTVLRWLSAP